MNNKKPVIIAVVALILLNIIYFLKFKFSILIFIGFNALVGAIITIPFIMHAKAKSAQKGALILASSGYGLVGCALIVIDGFKCCDEIWNILVIIGVMSILIGKGIFFVNFYMHKQK